MQTKNRTGDKVAIAGSYQYDALYRGSVFQRTWHRLKLSTAASLAACNYNSTILDVGCGSGTLIPFIGNNKLSYLGIDANDAAIQFCREHYKTGNYTFRQMLFDDLGLLPPKSFTHIFFLETIEHITRQQGQQVLQHFNTLLQEDGICVISTPNRKSCWPLIEKLLDWMHLTPRISGDQHELLYSKNELVDLAQDANFTIRRVVSINGLAPWLSFLGTRAVESIHQWELKQSWWAGSLILLVLQKKTTTE